MMTASMTAITLIAKWPSTCFECGDRIEPGEQISWDREAPRGQNTSHVRCPGYDDDDDMPTAVPATAAAPKPARRPVGLQRRATAASASTSSFPPTGEQLEAQRLFSDDGADLAIEAGAGTGKTATLILLANSTPRRGQYVAFNKSIVQEAATKMPATVTCSTAHSLAYRSVGFKYAARLGSSRRMRSADIASHLKIGPLSFGEVTLSPSFLAGHVMAAVTHFCQSAAALPNQFHVPRLPMPNPDEAAERHQLLAAHLLPAMSAAWNDLMNVDGVLPFKHEHYLKAWQLSGPRISADYILFDECQDANPVMLAIVDAQDHAQRVYVGDANQAIYGFTGAVNALERIRESGGQIATLTQSFRFGPAIADKANYVLDLMPESTLRLTGTETIDSVVEPVRDPNVILCRTNAGAVATVMRFQKTGKRVALVGGGDAFVRFAKAAQTLMAGGRTEHPELACFSSWQSVRAYVDEDGQGSELRLLVKLIDDFGVDGIIAALSRLQDERTAEITISTAHKSKGREWKAVQLAGDFMPVPKMNIDELRLLYVAVTRAKLRLDDTQIDYIGEED